MINKIRSVLMIFVLLSVSLLILQPINAALATLPKDSNITVQRIVSPGIDRSTYAKQLLASDQFPDILQSINTQDFIDANLLIPWDSKWIEDHFIIPDGNA